MPTMPATLAAARATTRAAALAAAMLACGLPVKAAAAPLLLRTAAQDNNTLKYELNGKRKGICMEVIKAVEQVSPGLRFTGWTQSWSLPRIESALAEGRLDTFCAMIPTSARAAKYTFIEIPIYSVRHKIAVRADDKVAIKSLEEIPKLGPDNMVIVSKGTAHETLLQDEPGLRLDASSRDTEVNLRKLLNKRGRFFYHTESTLRRTIAEQHMTGMVTLLPTVFREEALYFAVSRKLAPDAAERLRQALQILAERGDLQKIEAGYKEY